MSPHDEAWLEKAPEEMILRGFLRAGGARGAPADRYFSSKVTVTWTL